MVIFYIFLKSLYLSVGYYLSSRHNEGYVYNFLDTVLLSIAEDKNTIHDLKNTAKIINISSIGSYS